MTRRSAFVALVLAALIAGGGCTSTASRSITPGTQTGRSTTTSAGSVPTTAAATTTSGVPSGWTTIDLTKVTGFPAYSCCGSDWYGAPSPALPADGGPLLDGNYFVKSTWAADPTKPLQLKVYRFESCAKLPSDTCEDPTGANAMEIDQTVAVPLTLSLDSHLKVVLTGFTSYADPSTMAAAAQGNGSDLAALAAALQKAYTDVFAMPLAAGKTPAAIMAAVAATPAEGFAGTGSGNEGVTFTFGAAPKVLIQAPFDQSITPPATIGLVEMLTTPSIQVVNGEITLYVYASYVS